MNFLGTFYSTTVLYEKTWKPDASVRVPGVGPMQLEPIDDEESDAEEGSISPARPEDSQGVSDFINPRDSSDGQHPRTDIGTESSIVDGNEPEACDTVEIPNTSTNLTQKQDAWSLSEDSALSSSSASGHLEGDKDPRGISSLIKELPRPGLQASNS